MPYQFTYSAHAGYVAHEGNAVLYLAKEAQIDTGTKYAAVCDNHDGYSEIVGCTTKAIGMASIKNTENFCQQCRDLSAS